MLTQYQRDLRRGVEVMGGVRPQPYPANTYAHARLPGVHAMPPAYHEWPGLWAQEGFGSCATGYAVEALPLSGQYDVPLRPWGFQRMAPCGFRCDGMHDPARWVETMCMPPFPFHMLAGY